VLGRFQACNLELHPGKTRIVYCKDINRTKVPDIEFTFLGYTSVPARRAMRYPRLPSWSIGGPQRASRRPRMGTTPLLSVSAAPIEPVLRLRSPAKQPRLTVVPLGRVLAAAAVSKPLEWPRNEESSRELLADDAFLRRISSDAPLVAIFRQAPEIASISLNRETTAVS
jgi:hypothetical protein